MDYYCFAPNQTFFKCLIYSDLLKKLKIFSTFIWISTGNYDLSYSANVIIFREMESRAGGLVRLPGSVGARPEGQSGAGLPVPVCHRVGLRRQLC